MFFIFRSLKTRYRMPWHRNECAPYKILLYHESGAGDNVQSNTIKTETRSVA